MATLLFIGNNRELSNLMKAWTNVKSKQKKKQKKQDN